MDLAKDDFWDVVLFTKPDGWCNSCIVTKWQCCKNISLKESLPSLSYKRFLDLWTSAHLFLIRGGSTVPFAASAPHQDLELDNNIKSFANVDPVVSAAALKAFSRHTWYLSGELIPLALWDEDVTYKEKNLLAVSINASQCSTSSASMEFTKRYSNGFGKPELPDVTAGQHLSLTQFATADSAMFFRILSIPSAFLAKPVTQ